MAMKDTTKVESSRSVFADEHGRNTDQPEAGIFLHGTGTVLTSS
jgi:hypothetical protein